MTEAERQQLNLSNIVEESKGLLSSIEQNKEGETAPKVEESTTKHAEEVIALDKHYEERSHSFAQKFLKDHVQEAKPQEPANFFAGVLDSSKSFLSDLMAGKEPKTAEP